LNEVKVSSLKLIYIKLGSQAAHYHNLGPKLGASLLTRHIGWKNRKKEKKKRRN
jgi:hypothetical protein